MQPLEPINNEVPSVSVCIFEILPKNRYRIFLEDDSYASRAWGYHSPQVTLEPNKHGYLLLCINFEREVSGRFELTLQTDKPLFKCTSFLDSYYKKVTKTIGGEWAIHNAGGCSSEPSFYKNP